jgi:SAM-dependent methyltransferase
VPPGCGGFDVAFSHEVLYLLHDLHAHARGIFAALSPGGVYYAVIGVHAASPMMAEWHHGNAQELRLPELYDIDEVIAVFEGAGFDGAAARLAVRFVPAATRGHHSRGRMLDWLDYYYDQKLMLRFRRQV